MIFIARVSCDHGKIFLCLRRLLLPYSALQARLLTIVGRRACAQQEEKQEEQPGLFQATAFQVCIVSGATTSSYPPANESCARRANINQANTHQSKLLPCESALTATAVGPARKKESSQTTPLEATAFHVNINLHGPTPTYQESHAGNKLLFEPVCFLGHCHPNPRRRRLHCPA